jgi:hypothetical protein
LKFIWSCSSLFASYLEFLPCSLMIWVFPKIASFGL